MAGYALCGSFRATPGEADGLAALLLEAAEALREAEGCLLWLVNRAADDPDAVWVMEVWSDEAAHGASLGLPSVRAIIDRARPLIAGPGERFELQPVGGHGLPSTDT